MSLNLSLLFRTEQKYKKIKERKKLQNEWMNTNGEKNITKKKIK